MKSTTLVFIASRTAPGKRIAPALVAAACILSATATSVVGNVRPEARIEIRPVVVTAKQILEMDRQMQDQPQASRRSIPRIPGRGIQVVGKRVSSPRVTARLSSSSLGELQRTAPLADHVSSIDLILGTNFQALIDNLTVIVPDTHGAVGPSHVMTMLNTQVHIQTKNGDDVAGWPVSLSAFWAPTGATGFFDPRIIYDSLTGRWMATVLSGLLQPSSAIHLAVHPGPDPSVGSWSFFTFPADPTDRDWADFPDIGCNTNWVALTVDMYTISSDDYSGAAMWVIERPIPLSGPAAAHVFPAEFDKVNGVSGISLRPCLTFDEIDTLYIVDSSGYIDDVTEVAMLRLSRLTGPIDDPVWSVQPDGSGQSDGLFTVPESNDFDYEPRDASQLGTTLRIETNYGDMLDAVFRNGHVWCTHAGGFPDSAPWWESRCAAFWYELDPSLMPEPILQAGVIDGGADVHHYYPSLAVDAFDNMCIGFTRSHTGIYAQAAFAGRLSGMSAGTLGPVQVLKLGVAPYTKSFGNSGIRWGDYSATVIDPVTDTFWVLQEYAETPVGSTTRWGTWWGEVNLDTTQVGVEDVGPTLSRLFPAPYPNPFTSKVVFVLNLERETDVRIDIFDLTGRRVRGLVAGRYPPGTYDLTWNGRDEQGRGVAGGMYFVRFRSEEGTIVHKIYKSSPVAPF